MQEQQPTAITNNVKNTALRYQFEAIMAEYASIQENIRQFEQAQQQFVIVMGAFLALGAVADKIFSLDLAGLWSFVPMASIFISAVSMFFITNALSIARSGLFLRVNLKPKLHRILTQVGLDNDEVLTWEQFRVDFDTRQPVFVYSVFPQVLLVVIPNISLMYSYVMNRPTGNFTFIDVLAIVALLAFVQVLISGALAIKLFVISEEDWNNETFFRLYKRRQ